MLAVVSYVCVRQPSQRWHGQRWHGQRWHDYDNDGMAPANDGMEIGQRWHENLDNDGMKFGQRWHGN